MKYVVVLSVPIACSRVVANGPSRAPRRRVISEKPPFRPNPRLANAAVLITIFFLLPVSTAGLSEAAEPQASVFGLRVRSIAAPLATAAATVDSDGDGVPDVDDNCPFAPNPDQLNTDGDGAGMERHVGSLFAEPCVDARCGSAVRSIAAPKRPVEGRAVQPCKAQEGP